MYSRGHLQTRTLRFSSKIDLTMRTGSGLVIFPTLFLPFDRFENAYSRVPRGSGTSREEAANLSQELSLKRGGSMEWLLDECREAAIVRYLVHI